VGLRIWRFVWLGVEGKHMFLEESTKSWKPSASTVETHSKKESVHSEENVSNAESNNGQVNVQTRPCTVPQELQRKNNCL